MEFTDKQILVLGAARSGVAAAKVLHERGARVVVSDSAALEKLERDRRDLDAIGVPLVAGGHPPELFDQGFELIVKNPGIPPSIPFLEEARRRGIPVISEVELAYQLTKGHILAVTGSNGKTTTTSWLGEMLKLDRPKVQVAGNIGVPLSLEAAQSDAETCLVVELSSFQLNDIRDFRAEVAAVLNITETHLDWHGDFAAYKKAKANILCNQRPGDTAVLNADDEESRSLYDQAKGEVLFFSRRSEVEQGAYLRGEEIRLRLAGADDPLLNIQELGIGYAHNIENAMAASLMAYAAGASLDHIRSALRSFKGLPHRFQIVAQKQGRTFINDSKATNPVASAIALTLPGQPIVLIAGGLERGLDLQSFAAQIKRCCRAVVLLGETKQRLAADLQKVGFSQVRIVEDMAEAVAEAYRLSQPGDTVLLSTGCASWDMYPSYEVRGADFTAQVGKIVD